ncbi:hypothetical protein V6N13_010867 [Hibiscus sabdariffa]
MKSSQNLEERDNINFTPKTFRRALLQSFELEENLNFSVLEILQMLPHRKFNRGKRARCCSNPQTISMEREPVESQRLLDAEAEQIQQTRETGSTNKRSGKAPPKHSEAFDVRRFRIEALEPS